MNTKKKLLKKMFTRASEMEVRVKTKNKEIITGTSKKSISPSRKKVFTNGLKWVKGNCI